MPAQIVLDSYSGYYYVVNNFGMSVNWPDGNRVQAYSKQELRKIVSKEFPFLKLS